MRAQRTRQREAVWEALKAAAMPIPQTIVDELALLNPTDALDVLKDHPGFKVWQRWKSYQAALALFERCMADLFAAIEAFEEVMREDDLFSGRQHHKRSEEHTSELQSLMSISYAVLYLKNKQYIDKTIIR